MHVVLIDTEVRLLELVSSYLVECQLSVTRYTDAVEGLAAARQPGTDAVVLDSRFPRMSGIQACGALRREGFHGYIMILSTVGTSLDRRAALAAGADDYLLKPFDLADLAVRLKAVEGMATFRSQRFHHLAGRT